jgi:hypothetical protein
MKRCSIRLMSVAAGLFLVMTACSSARAQEKVENPAYAAWSKFKPNTAVKYKNINKVVVMGNEVVSESDLTQTLLEVTEDKVVVQYDVVTKTMGMEFKTPPSKQEYPRLIPLKPGQKKENVGKPDNLLEEGSETIKVPAGEFKTKWTKNKVEDRVLQNWLSDTVPGTLVKSATTIGNGFTGTNVMELVEVKKP